MLAMSMEKQLPQLSKRLGALMGRGQLVVVIELGGNDRLFGVPATQIEAALDKIVRSVQKIGASAIIMEIIPDGIERDVAGRC